MDQINLEQRIAALPRQARRVAHYMLQFGEITPLQAFADLGVTRLAARIFDMRQADILVYDGDRKARNRFGETVRYKAYWLRNSVNPDPMDGPAQ